MGRYVYESGNCVWKYVFGEQPSEQGKIVIDYNIGKLLLQVSKGCQNEGDCENCKSDECCPSYEIPYNEANEEEFKNSEGDIVELDYSDIPALKKIIADAGENYIKAKEIYEEAWKDKQHGMPFDECRELAKKTSALCGGNFNFYMMIEAYIEYMEKEYEKEGITAFCFIGEY